MIKLVLILDQENKMEEGRRKKKRIHALIVDPDVEVGQGLKDKFQKIGYYTDVEQNAKGALNLVKEFFYNIAVVEVELPDMKGIEFLRVIKEIHPDTAVVFITRNPSLENSVDALNLGASAYLMKPLQVEKMIHQINEVLEKQKNIIETRELLFAERKKREFYQYLSIRDGLTDLYNHRYFHELLNQEMASAVRYNQSLSLLMIDIDNFKNFNDSFGHPAGDHALQEIAKLFKDNCRRVDNVCRYGGEEFAIITPETSGKNVVYLAQRLLDKLREAKLQVFDSSIEVTLYISIGLASYPTDAKNKDELIIQADHNLLQAKKAGKDCYYPPPAKE